MALILAVDTSAKPVSCALVRNGQVISSFYSNTGLTHSQTLMPMIETVLQIADVNVNQLDAIAVNAGPGSFTGVRIGVSAVKGIAFTCKTPCISVSTLECMAENTTITADSAVCCVMDARCQQVYSALFKIDETGKRIRLWDDEAQSVADLGKKLKNIGKPVILVGDGSEMCYNALKEEILDLVLAPPSSRYQNAAATAVIAERQFVLGKTIAAEDLLPIYLRLPQAERELNNRLAQK